MTTKESTVKAKEITRLMLRFEQNEIDCANEEMRDRPNWKLVAVGLLNHLSRNKRLELIDSWGLRSLLENDAEDVHRILNNRMHEQWSDQLLEQEAQLSKNAD